MLQPNIGDFHGMCDWCACVVILFSAFFNKFDRKLQKKNRPGFAVMETKRMKLSRWFEMQTEGKKQQHCIVMLPNLSTYLWHFNPIKRCEASDFKQSQTSEPVKYVFKVNYFDQNEVLDSFVNGFACVCCTTKRRKLKKKKKNGANIFRIFYSKPFLL